MCIFDFLDFDELVNVAVTSDRFCEIITNRYMIPVFRIHEKVILAVSESPTDTGKTIVIKNIQTIALFLRTFGHLISTLQFTTKSSRNLDDIEQINDYIIEYCSETVIKLELDSQSARLTTNSSKIFKRLTKLKLDYWVYFERMNINRNFPVLEELTIDTPYPLPDIIGQFYSNLNCLHLLTSRVDASDSAIKKVLRLNSQLRALTIQGVPSFTLLKFISEISMNLEQLSIGYRMKGLNLTNGETIHFEHLKSFSLHSKDWVEQAHEASITFKNLEKLELLSYNFFPNNLLKHNFELKSISLPLASAVTALQILMQAGPFRRLEEVKMQWSDDLNNILIRQMADRFRSLQRIIFIVHVVRGNELGLDAISDRLKSDWRVIDHECVGIDGGIDIFHLTATRDSRAVSDRS